MLPKAINKKQGFKMNEHEEIYFAYTPPHRHLWAFICLCLSVILVYIILSTVFMYYDTKAIAQHLIKLESSVKEVQQECELRK